MDRLYEVLPDVASCDVRFGGSCLPGLGESLSAFARHQEHEYQQSPINSSGRLLSIHKAQAASSFAMANLQATNEEGSYTATLSHPTTSSNAGEAPIDGARAHNLNLAPRVNSRNLEDTQGECTCPPSTCPTQKQGMNFALPLHMMGHLPYV